MGLCGVVRIEIPGFLTDVNEHSDLSGQAGRREGTGLLLEPKGEGVSAMYQEGLCEAGLPVIVFGVDDIQAEFTKLKDRGVTFTKEPTKVDWGIEAIFDDTCGNLIQMIQV